MKNVVISIFAIGFSLLSSAFAHADSYTCKTEDGKVTLTFIAQAFLGQGRAHSVYQTPTYIQFRIGTAEKDSYGSLADSSALELNSLVDPEHGTFKTSGYTFHNRGHRHQVTNGVFILSVDVEFADGQVKKAASGQLYLSLNHKVELSDAPITCVID